MTIDTSRFDLTKATETLDKFLLEKGMNTAPTMRVAAVLDISGSMHSIIKGGELQYCVNQLVPVGLKFDDNGEVDVFKFDNTCRHVGTMDRENYADYVAKKGINANGGTEYAPIVRSLTQYYFPNQGKGGLLGMFSKPQPVDNTPVLALIITDGECSDRSAALDAFKQAATLPIYWHFVAVGGASFPTIKMLADLLPNVGDVYLPRFGLSEEEVYRQVVCDELVQWVNK